MAVACSTPRHLIVYFEDDQMEPDSLVSRRYKSKNLTTMGHMKTGGFTISAEVVYSGGSVLILPK